MHRTSPDQPVTTVDPPEEAAEGPLSRDKHNVGRGMSGSGDGDGKVSASGDFAGGGSTAKISDPSASTTTGFEDGNATKATKVSASSSLSTADPAVSPKGVSVKLSNKTMNDLVSTATASTATTATGTLTPNPSVASSKQRSQSPTHPSTTTGSKCSGNGADSSSSAPSPTPHLAMSAAADVLRSLPLEKETDDKKIDDVEGGVTACDRISTDAVSSSVGGRKSGRPADRGGGAWNGEETQTLYTQEAVKKIVEDMLKK